MQYCAILGSTAVSVTLWSWSERCGCAVQWVLLYDHDHELKDVAVCSECYFMIMKWKVWLCSAVSVTLWSWTERCGCVQCSECYFMIMKWKVWLCSAVSVTLWSWSWSEKCGCAVQWVLHYDQEVNSGCVHYSECYIMIVYNVLLCDVQWVLHYNQEVKSVTVCGTVLHYDCEVYSVLLYAVQCVTLW